MDHLVDDVDHHCHAIEQPVQTHDYRLQVVVVVVEVDAVFVVVAAAAAARAYRDAAALTSSV